MNDEELFHSSERLLGRFDFAAQVADIEQKHHEQTNAMLLSFIEVMDSFDRLFNNTTGEAGGAPGHEGTWLGSVWLIARQMERALRKAGVTPIECLNQQSDPEKHFIVGVKEMPGVEEDTIVEEVLRGYERDGEVLRIPHVIVAGIERHRQREE